MLIAAICTGNTCRSPMLEVLLGKALADFELKDVAIVSAGVAANDDDAATPEAVETMKGYGLDLSNHRSRHIDRIDLPRVDMFITMSDSHAGILEHHGVDPQKIVVAAADSGGIPDPFGGSLRDYQQTAEVLNAIARDFAKAAKDAGSTRRLNR